MDTSRGGGGSRAQPVVRAIAILGSPGRDCGERRQFGPAPGTQRGGTRGIGRHQRLLYWVCAPCGERASQQRIGFGTSLMASRPGSRIYCLVNRWQAGKRSPRTARTTARKAIHETKAVSSATAGGAGRLGDREPHERISGGRGVGEGEGPESRREGKLAVDRDQPDLDQGHEDGVPAERAGHEAHRAARHGEIRRPRDRGCTEFDRHRRDQRGRQRGTGAHPIQDRRAEQYPADHPDPERRFGQRVAGQPGRRRSRRSARLRR